MIDYKVIEEVTTRVGYRVAAPVNLAELNKVVAQVSNSFRARKGRPVEFDDDLNITGDGETITVYFEVTQAEA